MKESGMDDKLEGYIKGNSGRKERDYERKSDEGVTKQETRQEKCGGENGRRGRWKGGSDCRLMGEWRRMGQGLRKGKIREA